MTWGDFIGKQASLIPWHRCKTAERENCNGADTTLFEVAVMGGGYLCKMNTNAMLTCYRSSTSKSRESSTTRENKRSRRLSPKVGRSSHLNCPYQARSKATRANLVTPLTTMYIMYTTPSLSSVEGCGCKISMDTRQGYQP